MHNTGKGVAKVNLTVKRAGVHRPMLLTSPVQDSLADFCAGNRAAVAKPQMIESGSGAGKVLALCGAGPSLAGATFDGADDVFACNSALPYLVARGVNVSAGVCIDQTPQTVVEWPSPPDVAYHLATTVDPALTQHVLAHGRDIRWFHSLVGFPDEISAYRKWPTGFLAFRGHNVVGRMIHVALWMGYERVEVYGADCAFGPGDVTHANGTTAEDAYGHVDVFQAEIDGRLWRTRADMLIAAVDLARVARDSGGRVVLMGDTLPAAIMGKGDEYLETVCRILAPGETISNA